MRRFGLWMRVVPAVGLMLTIGWPLARYVQRTDAEAAAVRFLETVVTAQQQFARSNGGAYASSLTALATSCPDPPAPPLRGDDLAALSAAGYRAEIRAADGAERLGADCAGQPLVSDYYAAVEPVSPEAPGRRALATTGDGRVFVFFDGVAPREADMRAGGLATPLESVDDFKIP